MFLYINKFILLFLSFKNRIFRSGDDDSATRLTPSVLRKP
ncbi:hypothetical protein BN132_1804 [Cronobacter turicensis 564]|nr:hypothetical protein BN132_1804 [Cronobacter turicensis 564]